MSCPDPNPDNDLHGRPRRITLPSAADEREQTLISAAGSLTYVFNKLDKVQLTTQERATLLAKVDTVRSRIAAARPYTGVSLT